MLAPSSKSRRTHSVLLCRAAMCNALNPSCTLLLDARRNPISYGIRNDRKPGNIWRTKPKSESTFSTGMSFRTANKLRRKRKPNHILRRVMKQNVRRCSRPPRIHYREAGAYSQCHHEQRHTSARCSEPERKHAYTAGIHISILSAPIIQ